MGILDHLGTVVKSYINDEEENTRAKRQRAGHADPDLNAAYEELDDYLNRDPKGKADAWKDLGDAGAEKKQERRKVPDELKQDFAELGLTPEASAEQCKAAYKKLLKIHHPDRPATHEGNRKKATEKAARINAAYERIMKWFKLNG
jgi:hypothetical protein